MQWKTAISSVNDGREIIRGYNLHELAQSKSFVEVVWLILRGELPTEPQARMLNVMLAIMIDHGVGIGSTMAARTVGSLGNQLHVAVATGLLGLGGTKHGGALEGAAQFFQEHVRLDKEALTITLQAMKEKKQRVPGYGHRVLTHDNRADTLFAIARETGVYGSHCELANTVRAILNTISSKPLPLNMDGANAAILSDLGFDWRMATGFFMMGRLPGLVAHVHEELTSGEGIRRLSEEEVVYMGPSDRAI